MSRWPVLGAAAASAWIIAWVVTNEVGFHPTQAANNPWAESIRVDFVARSARLGGDGAALLPGLVLGDTSAVSESLSGALRVSALTHLTAVSGSNCAVVTGLVFGVAALVGLGLWWRIGLAASALIAFVTVVGGEPSVLRASAMALIALGALAWGAPLKGLTVLCLAVLSCLAVDPSLAHSVGFALSVSATLGLLTLVRPLVARLVASMPAGVATVIAVPISATIACQPIIFAVAPFVPTYGVLANMLADPLVPVATVAGLLALITSAIPWVSSGFLAIAWACAHGVAFIARTIASWPFSRIPWPAGVWGVLLGVVVSLAIALWILRLVPNHALVVPVIAVTGALSLTVGADVVAWATAPKNWSWAQCDVGQGDAVVLRDAGRVAVVDVGRDETALRECLDRLAVKRIDLLVLTHFDIDHVGAIGALYGRVGTVLHGPPDGVADEVILSLLRSSGARVVSATRGMSGGLGRLRWTVLWPDPSIPVEPGNPASVVVRFDPGAQCDSTCVDGVDLGDLPGAEQGILLREGVVSTATIVKVSHHGSSDQNPALYRALHASVGLIGVGVDNDYGHPTFSTLDMLAATGTLALRSDRHGIVLVTRDSPNHLSVWREKS